MADQAAKAATKPPTPTAAATGNPHMSKTGYEVFCDLIYTSALDNPKIALLIFAQFFFMSIYYGPLFGKRWTNALTRDKGLKRHELWVLGRYSFFICSFGALACNGIRTLAIEGFVTLIGAFTLCMYQQIALFVWMVGLISVDHNFWAQKPLSVILINQGADLSCALLSATLSFYIRECDFSAYTAYLPF